MGVKIFSSVLLDNLVCEASQSPRKRRHLNIHQNYEDKVQRLFNAIGIDSYIRPHRHSLDPKTESLLAIRGRFALVLFNESGAPTEVVEFGVQSDPQPSAAGVELLPGKWHTVIALQVGSVLLELKEGPFREDAAKEFAPWAPEEGSPGADRFYIALRRMVDEWTQGKH